MRLFAAIDVGSYELAMKVFEFSVKNGMKEIDHIRYRVELGTDTYHTGKISPERMDEMCGVLCEFARIMKGYKVEAYKAYATSAIRETKNTLLVIEQIKLRTGIEVEVLSNSEQRFLNYKAVASKGDTFDKFINQGCAILDIGGGSIQLSLFDDDCLVTTQNIRLGVLRMMDMLSMLQPRTRDFDNVIRELIDNQLYYFKRLYMRGKDLEKLIIVDDYISPVVMKNSPENTIISTDSFKDNVDRIKDLSNEELAKNYDVAEETARMLTPSLAIVLRVLKVTKAKEIWMPSVALCDGIAYEYAEKEKLFKNPHDFENDIIQGAYVISKRYQGNIDRNKLLDKISVKLFDSMKKIHKMDRRDKILLRIAAILNDCGRYISLEAGAECGYNIIMATEMIGLSHTEREIVANVVRFNKVQFDYFKEAVKKENMSEATYLRIAKLSAIFRVADGICRSHGTKVNDISTVLKDNEMHISIDVDYGDDIALEQGFFYRKSQLFEEVFAIKPVLRSKRKTKEY